MDEEDNLLLLQWEDDSLLLLEDFSDVPASCDNENSNQISTNREELLQQIDEDLDYAFALSLQTQYEDEINENISFDSKKSDKKDSQPPKPLSIIDEQWELLDPHPDIHALFQEYDKKFFYGKLKTVEVRWSPRMTLCAGVCCYEGRGGLCSIRLSVPLLKLRPRKDLVETLLHEMIHAYLFVTNNNKDRSGHGPEFLSHMHRINKESGTRITVYHSFHDEVDLYRQHWWKCDGPCKDRRPYYGVLKRAMNRPPGPKDNWWADHQASCGGTFTKIKEPDDYGKKKAIKRKATSESKAPPSDIRNFFKDDAFKDDRSVLIPSTAKSSTSHFSSASANERSNIVTFNSKCTSPKKQFVPFQGTGHKIGGSGSLTRVPPHLQGNSHNKVVSVNSSRKTFDIAPLSEMSKVPKLSHSEGNLYKDEKPSTSILSNNVTRNLVQSPIEKFLSSRNLSNDSNPVKKGSFANPFTIDESSKEENGVKKVSCPVCFTLVKEQDINLHLDTCLLN